MNKLPVSYSGAIVGKEVFAYIRIYTVTFVTEQLCSYKCLHHIIHTKMLTVATVFSYIVSLECERHWDSYNILY